jgi:hypothetical protein
LLRSDGASICTQASESQLFSHLLSLPEAQQAILLGPSTGHAQGCRLSLVAPPVLVAETLLGTAKTMRDFTEYLPPEIIIEIGKLAVDPGHPRSGLSDLARVSHRWNVIFSEYMRMIARPEPDSQTQNVSELRRAPVVYIEPTYPRTNIALAGLLSAEPLNPDPWPEFSFVNLHNH